MKIDRDKAKISAMEGLSFALGAMVLEIIFRQRFDGLVVFHWFGAGLLYAIGDYFVFRKNQNK